MKRILITGANSYIGTSFEEYMNQWPDEYVVDTLDMLNLEWKNYDFSNYDVVFHVSGIAHSDNGKISEEKKKLYYKVNTELTIETAKKAKAEGVKQFIFMSSIIVYGEASPIGKKKVINENTPVNPSNCYGDSKVKAEEGIKQLSDDRFHVAILRPPMIYGKGCKGNYNLISKIARKTFIFPYTKSERSIIYIKNLMKFISLIINNDEKGVFYPQNKNYMNITELVKMISNIHNNKVHIIRGLYPILKVTCIFSNTVRKAFGNLAYDTKMSDYTEEYRMYDLENSIGEIEFKKGDKSK